MIRQAVPADATAIARIHVLSWQTAYRGLLPDSLLDHLSPARREQRWRERLVAGQAAVLVADGRAGLLGFAAFGPSRDDDLDPSQVGEIYAIYLLPKAWGQGHGSALLRQALDKLQAQGLDETTLWVLRDNQRAIDFYQAHGFQADGAAKHETRGDSVILHEVRFRRRP